MYYTFSPCLNHLASRSFEMVRSSIPWWPKWAEFQLGTQATDKKLTHEKDPDARKNHFRRRKKTRTNGLVIELRWTHFANSGLVFRRNMSPVTSEHEWRTEESTSYHPHPPMEIFKATNMHQNRPQHAGGKWTGQEEWRDMDVCSHLLPPLSPQSERRRWTLWEQSQ